MDGILIGVVSGLRKVGSVKSFNQKVFDPPMLEPDILAQHYDKYKGKVLGIPLELPGSLFL